VSVLGDSSVVYSFLLFYRNKIHIADGLCKCCWYGNKEDVFLLLWKKFLPSVTFAFFAIFSTQVQELLEAEAQDDSLQKKGDSGKVWQASGSREGLTEQEQQKKKRTGTPAHINVEDSEAAKHAQKRRKKTDQTTSTGSWYWAFMFLSFFLVYSLFFFNPGGRCWSSTQAHSLGSTHRQ